MVYFSFVKFTEEKLEKLLPLVINLPVRKEIKGTVCTCIA